MEKNIKTITILEFVFFLYCLCTECKHLEYFSYASENLQLL